MWLSKPRQGLVACIAKGVPSFLSYFKTLCIGPASWIKPPAVHSTSLLTELIPPKKKEEKFTSPNIYKEQWAPLHPEGIIT